MSRMNGMKTVMAMVFCSVFFLLSSHEALAADYSVTATNNIYKIYKGANPGSPCQLVRLEYWSGGNGSRAELPSALGMYTPQTLTVKNVHSCSSLELTATCHYFQTSYTHYGQLSQTSWSQWVDETKTQTIPCGCHAVSIELELADQGTVKNTVLKIVCP